MSMCDYPAEIQKAAKLIMFKADEFKPSITLTKKEKKAIEPDEDGYSAPMSEILSPERSATIDADYKKYCEAVSSELKISLDDAMNICGTAWWEMYFGEGYPYYSELNSICSDLTKIGYNAAIS